MSECVSDEDGPGGAAAELSRRYLGGSDVDQFFAQEDLSQTINDPARVLWLVQGNLGSVRDVIDNEGDVINRIDYDPFGNILSVTDPSNSNVSADLLTSVTFTGQMWDADLGLYYYNARWYDAVVGKFISRDPLGFDAGDANLYRYVGNSPVNFTDPSGMQSIRVGGNNKGQIVIGGCRPSEIGKVAAVARATRAACGCIDKALDLLTNHYNSVKHSYAATVQDGRRLLNAEGRDRVIAMLRNAQNACKSDSGRIRIVCDRWCSGSATERLAYVNFFPGSNWRTGNVIHVCPRFFGAPPGEQADTILHEFGRFYNSLGETNTGTWNDVFVWDNIVMSLCSNYDRILNGKTV